MNSIYPFFNFLKLSKILRVAVSLCLFLVININLQAQGTTLFNDNYIHEIRFTSVDTMIFINTEDYQSVNMLFDGFQVTNVGLKQKGNISATHANNKIPFKIKTNEYVSGREYDGIREFTLNNSFQDPSMMREKMSYDIAEELGLYSLRTAYAKVYMDNNYWGVYTIVEGKDEMFKHIFGNKDGDAIESTDLGDLCYYGANRSDYQHPAVGERYIVDNGDDVTAWSRLIDMLDKANNTSNASYINTVFQYLNISHFARYQAMNVYFLNFDSYIGFVGNQLYFYDENPNIWQVIPWDFNASFGLWNTNNFGPLNYPVLPSSIVSGCVASNISTNTTMNDYYLNTMCDLVTNHADTNHLNILVDNWKTQIQSAVYTDWRKEFTNDDFNKATGYGYYTHNGETVPAMKTFNKDRQETVAQGLVALNHSCSTPTFNVEIENEFKIYPNPTSGSFTFQIGENTINEILEIFNAQGQKVQELVVTNDILEINISELQSGLYFVKYKNDTQRLVLVK